MNDIEPLEKRQDCKTCGHHKPPGASANCDCVPCRTCREPMPLLAYRCNACSTSKGIWGKFHLSNTVLALLIALFSVLSTTIPVVRMWLERNSETRVAVIGATDTAILVKVLNTGRKPSLLQSYTLGFSEELPFRPETLELSDADKEAGKNYVEPGQVNISFTVYDLGLKEKLPKMKLEDAIASGLATLVVCVEESSGEPGECEKRTVVFPAKRIEKLLSSKE